MQVGSFRYEIEPIENSSTFQHLIYRRDSEQRQPCRGVLVEGADLKSGSPELKMIDNHSLIPSEKSVGLFPACICALSIFIHSSI